MEISETTSTTTTIPTKTLENTFAKNLDDGGEGGYDVDLVDRDDLPHDLKCAICWKLMRDPVQLGCGHGYCGSCFANLKKRSQRSSKISCPTCRTAVNPKKVTENKMLKRFISSLRVKCKNSYRGCKWEGEVGNIESRICDQEFVTCKRCGAEVKRYLMADHPLSCFTSKESELVSKNKQLQCIIDAKDATITKLATELEKSQANNQLLTATQNLMRQEVASLERGDCDGGNVAFQHLHHGDSDLLDVLEELKDCNDFIQDQHCQLPALSVPLSMKTEPTSMRTLGTKAKFTSTADTSDSNVMVNVADEDDSTSVNLTQTSVTFIFPTSPKRMRLQNSVSSPALLTDSDDHSAIAPIFTTLSLLPSTTTTTTDCVSISKNSFVRSTDSYFGSADSFVGSTDSFVGSTDSFVGSADSFVGSTDSFVDESSSLYSAERKLSSSTVNLMVCSTTASAVNSCSISCSSVIASVAPTTNCASTTSTTSSSCFLDPILC